MHCRTGSPLARTNLSPFARCTLGLNRHFYLNIFMHDSGLYIQKILTNREMVNCQKFIFFAIFNNKFGRYSSARIERD